MPNKIQVPQNVADAIDALRKLKWNNDRFFEFDVIEHSLTAETRVLHKFIKDVGPAVYAKVIVTEDWEVMLSMKERLKEYYKLLGDENYLEARAAVFNTLKLLSDYFPELKGVLD